MKKIRCFLAVIALVATLSGLSLQGMGVRWQTQLLVNMSVLSSPSGNDEAQLRHQAYGPCPRLSAGLLDQNDER